MAVCCGRSSLACRTLRSYRQVAAGPPRFTGKRALQGGERVLRSALTYTGRMCQKLLLSSRCTRLACTAAAWEWRQAQRSHPLKQLRPPSWYSFLFWSLTCHAPLLFFFFFMVSDKPIYVACCAFVAGCVALALSNVNHGRSLQTGMEGMGAGLKGGARSLEEGLKGGARELRLGMVEAAAHLHAATP